MRRLVAVLLLIALGATPANAEERITRYLSDVQVQPDSSLEVTETIDVIAENVRINHGIYREFPTRYEGQYGSQVRVGFDFEGATLDGAPVPASSEAMRNGVRIKIGDPEKFVAPGEHRYQIRYRTTRQIGRFEKFDELYWNATGAGWLFPIDVAEARIRLPQAVRFGQRTAYTGVQGASGSNATVVEERPGDILFRTTAPLGPGEGLTVAVAFPKGVVAKPSSGSRWRDWLADYGPLLASAVTLVGLVAFYFLAWRRAGKDPRAGTVVPIFAPPVDLTPAAMRYVTKMGSDNRTFAAALVDMGVRGHIRMVEEEGGWLARDKTRLERTAGPEPLPAEEEAALRELVMTGESIMMEQKEHAKFSAAQKGLSEVLKSQYEGKLFNKNWGWAIAGVLLFAAAVWLVAASIVAAVGLDITSALIALGAGLTVALIMLWIQTASAVGKCLATLIAFGFAALAISTGAPVFFQALETGWLLPFAGPLLALPLVASAFMWIDAPTKEGRQVLDRIAGFKQYLSITERERLDRMTPPEDTPELFERYLPYAIALGVENRWAERFSGVLAAAAAQGSQGFAWYSGHGDPWNNPGGFVGTVGSALASSVSSASSAPGSSSGSGGGGSSGGGGGGGGGGGW